MVMDKDTEELEHELKSADIKDYLEENRDNLRQYTLAQYLEKLLAEKGLVKAEVVKRSNLCQEKGSGPGLGHGTDR